jgi:hypothetical protein
LTTTFVSSNQLNAIVPLSDNWYRSVYPNSYAISVTNPDGTASGSATLTITEPVPNIASINPMAAASGSSITLTVNGTNFLSGASVNWNGAALTTTFVSASQLTATVSATQNSGYASYPQSIPVLVTNPGGTPSNTVNQTIID